MEKLKSISLVCFVCVLMISCSDFFNKEIPIRLEDHVKLIVLNSFIEDGQEELLFALTTSRSMMDTNSLTLALEDVDIQLKVNQNDFLNVSFDTSINLFKSFHRVNAGDTIGIKVNSPYFPDIDAKTIIPRPAKITDARIGAKAFDSNGREVREIFFTVEDIKNEQNYFFVDLVNHDGDGRNWEGAHTFDSPLKFFSKAEFVQSLAFSDTFFQNSTAELMLWLSEGEFQHLGNFSSGFYVRLYSVEKNLFTYATQLHTHLRNRDVDLFSGEPINVHSNIKNGHGILGSFSYFDFQIDYTDFIE